MIRRSLHEGLIQCSMAEPNTGFSRPYHPSLTVQRQEDSGGRRKGTEKQSGIYTIKSVV